MERAGEARGGGCAGLCQKGGGAAHREAQSAVCVDRRRVDGAGRRPHLELLAVLSVAVAGELAVNVGVGARLLELGFGRLGEPCRRGPLHLRAVARKGVARAAARDEGERAAGATAAVGRAAAAAPLAKAPLAMR